MDKDPALIECEIEDIAHAIETDSCRHPCESYLV